NHPHPHSSYWISMTTAQLRKWPARELLLQLWVAGPRVNLLLALILLRSKLTRRPASECCF
ncbi:MAG: hypothetical protein L0Z50_41605, partial [Verrucomicrobiales bacterium]|nr:hypothetical protein [Verrucomicrobiales bacterium]